MSEQPKEDKIINISSILAVLGVVIFGLTLGIFFSEGELRGILPLVISGVLLSIMLYALVVVLSIKFKKEEDNFKE